MTPAARERIAHLTSVVGLIHRVAKEFKLSPLTSHDPTTSTMYERGMVTCRDFRQLADALAAGEEHERPSYGSVRMRMSTPKRSQAPHRLGMQRPRRPGQPRKRESTTPAPKSLRATFPDLDAVQQSEPGPARKKTILRGPGTKAVAITSQPGQDIWRRQSVPLPKARSHRGGDGAILSKRSITPSPQRRVRN